MSDAEEMIQWKSTGPALKSALHSFWTATRIKERAGGGWGSPSGDRLEIHSKDVQR